MLFREIIDSPCGMRYMADTLELRSAAGRRRLMESPMLCAADRIKEAYRLLREVHGKLVADPSARDTFRALGIKLRAVRDCAPSILHLEEGGDGEEVLLLEIKSLALLCRGVQPLLAQAGIDGLTLPDLEPVLRLLDPDRTGIASFYVYDSYDPELGRLRALIRSGDPCCEEWLLQSRRIEERICRELSDAVRPFAPMLRHALDTLAETDLLLGKAMQIETGGLSFPELAQDGQTCYRGVFHPQVRSEVEAAGRCYQCVDFRLDARPVTLIGANMGGKTVVLRTLALAQYLFQFGFGIPAAQAVVRPVDEVRLRVGDARREREGLSSFGAEVVSISETIARVRGGANALVLLDEPARTTNPAEGAALVAALVELLGRSGSRSVVTTHYDLPHVQSCRLKVRGMTEHGKMDYSLDEVEAGEVPHEALAVARALGIDSEWIGRAQQLLDRTNEEACIEKYDKK